MLWPEKMINNPELEENSIRDIFCPSTTLLCYCLCLCMWLCLHLYFVFIGVKWTADRGAVQVTGQLSQGPPAHLPACLPHPKLGVNAYFHADQRIRGSLLAPHRMYNLALD